MVQARISLISPSTTLQRKLILIYSSVIVRSGVEDCNSCFEPANYLTEWGKTLCVKSCVILEVNEKLTRSSVGASRGIHQCSFFVGHGHWVVLDLVVRIFSVDFGVVRYSELYYEGIDVSKEGGLFIKSTNVVGFFLV